MIYDRLDRVHRVLILDRADCESKREMNCEDCCEMPGCETALALIDIEVLRGAKLVDVGQAKGELLILETALRGMDWERLAREHPDLLAEEMQSLVRWRVVNALRFLGAEVQ